jgi:hypothetical protein
MPSLMMKLNNLSRFGTVAIFIAAVSLPVYCYSQERPVRQSFTVSFATASIRSDYPDSDEYTGYGGEYAFRPTTWLSLNAQATVLPGTQSEVSSSFGYGVIELAGIARAGPQVHRVRLQGELGSGVMFARVFSGYSAIGTTQAEFRRYPMFLAGAATDVSLGRHWSLLYEARLSLVFIPAFQPTNVPPGFAYLPAFHTNNIEGRAGLAFHF